MVSENNENELDDNQEEDGGESDESNDDPIPEDDVKQSIEDGEGGESLDQEEEGEEDELSSALDEAWDDDEGAKMEDGDEVGIPGDGEIESVEDADGEETLEGDGDMEIMDDQEVIEPGPVDVMLDGEPGDADDDDVPAISVKKEESEDYENTFIKSQIEAVLFVSSQGVTAEEINVKLGIRKTLVEKLLDELAFDYLERSTSLEIAKVGEKYVLQLKPEFTSYVKKFASGGLIREAVMRTLTIVAAKQPMMQSQLSKLRSNAGEHLKEMEELGLIRREPKGRSKLITTTNKFADMFGFSRDISRMKEQIKVFLMQDSEGEE